MDMEFGELGAGADVDAVAADAVVHHTHHSSSLPRELPDAEGLTASAGAQATLGSGEDATTTVDPPRELTAPDPDITPRAAQRVFDLPELLEHILVCVSLASDDVFERKDGSIFLQPTRHLFVLQRVNSLFKHTICRNKLIQQRMFLKAYPENSNDVMLASAGPHIDNLDFSPYSRMRWVGQFLEIREKEDSLGVDIFEAVSEHDFDGPRLAAECEFRESASIVPRAKNPESSWRKMKLHCFETGEPLTLQFDGEAGLPLRLAKFPCDDLMTLGRFHDGLHRLLPDLKALDDTWKHYESWEDYDAARNDIGERICDLCHQADLWG